MTPQQELGLSLYEHILKCYQDFPAQWLQRAAWVMNREWFDELKAWNDAYGHAIWAPPNIYLLGRPVFVTEDGGVPHLIAD